MRPSVSELLRDDRGCKSGVETHQARFVSSSHDHNRTIKCVL